jgi:hypothetical protein
MPHLKARVFSNNRRIFSIFDELSVFPVRNIGYNLNAPFVTKAELELTIQQRIQALMTEIMGKIELN